MQTAQMVKLLALGMWVGWRLAGVPALAAPEVDWTVTPDTSNSRVQVSGSWPRGYSTLTLAVAREGNAPDVINIPMSGSRIVLPVYLREGQGTYELRFWVSGPQNREGDLVLEQKVLNRDRREQAQYLLPSANVQSDDRRIVQLAHQITAGARSDYDRVLAVHDWVARNISYDTAALVGQRYREMDWNALRVLEARTAVCQGYSSLAAALLRAVGIPARVMGGWMGDKLRTPAESRADLRRAVARRDATYGHTWSEAFVRDRRGLTRWVMFDITSDAGTVTASSDGGEGTYHPEFKRTYFDPAPSLFETYYVNDEPYWSY